MTAASSPRIRAGNLHPIDSQSERWSPDSALLWLEMLALILGALQFAWAPATLHSPWVGMSALALLAATSVLVRAVPARIFRPALAYATRVVALLGYSTLILAAIGSPPGSLVCLYLIPLACAALSLGSVAVLFATIAAGLLVLALEITLKVDVKSVAFLAGFAVLLLPGGTVSFIVARLVERIQKVQEQLLGLADTDTQTGLLNLPAFEKVLQREHERAERLGRTYSIAFIDIDNLKLINETISHDAGTQMIAAVAAAIMRSIRTSDIAARLGGDDFVVLLNETDAATAAAVCQRIRNNVYAGTLSVNNRLLRGSVSLGTTNYPRDYLDVGELMVHAEQRMRQDRELRRPVAR